MKTTHGIPCNDHWHSMKAEKDRIEFRFVNTDLNTPSRCTIRIGDTDPMTGKAITDIGFFLEYHKLAAHQIYMNSKETKNRLSLDGMLNDSGESELDQKTILSIPADDPFSENEPDNILRLREIAASLNGRLADVYEALLVNNAGGQEKITMTSIALKWHVSVKQVCKDREKIIRMIREAVDAAQGEQD